MDRAQIRFLGARPGRLIEESDICIYLDEGDYWRPCLEARGSNYQSASRQVGGRGWEGWGSGGEDRGWRPSILCGFIVILRSGFKREIVCWRWEKKWVGGTGGGWGCGGWVGVLGWWVGGGVEGVVSVGTGVDHNGKQRAGERPARRKGETV